MPCCPTRPRSPETSRQYFLTKNTHLYGPSREYKSEVGISQQTENISDRKMFKEILQFSLLAAMVVARNSTRTHSAQHP